MFSKIPCGFSLDFLVLNECVSVCEWCPAMEQHSHQGLILLPCTECSWARPRINHNPDQEKAFTQHG